MSLSSHVNADDLIKRAEDNPHLDLLARAGGRTKNHAYHTSQYGRYQTEPIPKYSVPQEGLDPDAAYNLINDELSLDGRPALNLASFVHTNMVPQAKQLMMDNISINMCDQDEYPATMAIHGRLVSMVADLWHAPSETNDQGERQPAQGVATTGSSEALMLATLAMKKVWQHKRKAAGKSFKEPGPNLVFGANAQVCIEKAARYFDCEERLVPTSKESKYRLDPKKAIEMCDENTIGVVVILGSTYTGHYEPVEEMSKLLDEYEQRTGHHIPIHVDAASGGFVAPFAHPSLKWDFALPRVVSINSSAHKFGGCYVGLGLVVFRNMAALPRELVFELHYLGSVEYSFGLNFSRPAAQVIAMYFNLLSRGYAGYKDVMEQNLKNARLLSRALELSGYYEVLSEIHHPIGGKLKEADEHVAEEFEPGLPVIAFRWTDELKAKNPHLQQKWVQHLLRAKGWICPNYELAPDCEKTEILRVVVREQASEDFIDQLVHDILSVTEDLLDRSSSAAHLALLAHPEPEHTQSSSGNAGGGKDKHRHHNLRKAASKPPSGAGHKGTGYAKQC